MPASPAHGDRPPSIPPTLNFTMNRIDGTPVNLAEDYAGKVVLVVNVASRCGYTPQYSALQQLHEKYHGQGLAILAFPANEFGNQEPGTNEEITQFCEENFGISFDLFEKVIVKGEGICPLYDYLTSAETSPDHAGEVRWNFEKFLIDREGRIVNRFRSDVTPDSPQMIDAIEAALDASSA